MVLDKFDMVDMGGIDLIESQGVAVEGLYQRLVESITLCRYQCLYNWKFNGILIPPSYVEMVVRDGSVWINEGVNVDENDVVHIYSLGANLTQVFINSNGDYTPPAGYDGFNFVGVSVPEPVLNTIYITENGDYTPEQGVDGFSSVRVSVESSHFIVDDYSQYLDRIFDSEIEFNSSYRIEVAFYADSYVNDGHIVGQSYNGSGSAFHLTTYNQRWFIGGTQESSFNADSDCPLYGSLIVYSAKTGAVSMNGVIKSTNFTMPTRAGNTYKLNTRGGSISTTGVYKYKYVKIFDSNEVLVCNWEFGHIVLDANSIYLAHDLVSGKYKAY